MLRANRTAIGGLIGVAARPRVLAFGGDRAHGLGAYPAALGFYRDAVELWPHQDPGWPMLLFRYGQTVNLVTATKGFDVLTEARDALLAAGDSGTAAEAEILIGETFWMQGQRDQHVRASTGG